MVDITVNRHGTRPIDITCVQRDFFLFIILYNIEDEQLYLRLLLVR